MRLTSYIVCLLYFQGMLLLLFGCGVPEIEGELQRDVPPQSDALQRPASSPAVESIQPPARKPPQEIIGWTFRPKFFTEYGDAVGGMCSIVKLADSDTPLILTARSLIGPHGGLRFDIATSDQANRIYRIELLRPSDGKTIHSIAAAPLTTLPSDLQSFGIAIGLQPTCGDIAAFRLPPEFAGPTGKLATDPLAVNDTVWIVGQEAVSESQTQLHEASIQWLPPYRTRRANPHPQRNPAFDRAGSSRDFMTLTLKDPNAKFQGLLGAPVVNQDGQVIAILNSVAAGKDGAMIGYGVPAGRFSEALATAVDRERLGLSVSVGGYSITLPDGYLPEEHREESGLFAWSANDPQIGNCSIILKILPNEHRLEGSTDALRNLIRDVGTLLARGDWHIGPGEGNRITLPGMKALKGEFSLAKDGMIDPWGRNASESGHIMVGINADNILLLVFRGDGVTRGTTAHLLAERAFNTLAREDYEPEPATSDGDKLTVVVSGVPEQQRDLVLMALVELIDADERTGMSADITESDLRFVYTTTLPPSEVAKRLHLGAVPEVNDVAREIRVTATMVPSQGDDHSSQAEQRSELHTWLEAIETRNVLLDPEQALEKLVDAKVPDNSSADLKQRVANAMADALLTDRPVLIFEEGKAMATIAKWDKTIARRRLAEFVARGDDDLRRVEAFNALVPIADESVIAQVVRALAFDPTGHNGDPAMEILARYPDDAEPLVIDLFEKNTFGEELERMNAIVLLGRIGGPESLKLLRELRASVEEDWLQKRIVTAIEQIEEREKASKN